jgi:asparagine synthase (glutamine-hydrolysing)
MSGIAGLARFDGAPVAPGLAQRMTAAMASRGPDGVGHWQGGCAALGHNMLRTTPESLGEAQPLANEDASVVLVLDGRVDNREDLKRDLEGRGAVLRDRCDAELVLRAYEAWGEACGERIIGEFAFVAWDARRRTLFAARDAAGTRHFYYHVGRGWAAFASEIRGLLALGMIEARLNELRVLEFVVSEFDRDDEEATFYEGIVRLPAGHAMRIDERGARAWRYWDPAGLPELRFASREECAEALLEQLRIAVACRLRAIGPVGAMLSGGLDSSSIVALVHKEFRGHLAQPLMTFSLVREDRAHCPEWLNISRVLEEGWLDATVLSPGASSQAWRAHVEAIGSLNEPFAFSDGYTDALLCDAARERGCRVLMDGMAGDLYFYSFARSIGPRRESLERLPAILAAGRRHEVENRLRILGRAALDAVMPRPVRKAGRGVRRALGFAGRDLALLRPECARRLLDRHLPPRHRALDAAGSRLDQAAHARIFTSGLLSFAHEVNGQVALARGVEPRSPFSDRRMIEFAVRMPIEMKLFAGWYKLLLREAMAGILPDAVRWREDLGNHPGGEFRASLIGQIARNAPDFWKRESLERKLDRWIDAASLGRAWDRYHASGDLETGLNLLALAVLAAWTEERFTAGAGASPLMELDRMPT